MWDQAISSLGSREREMFFRIAALSVVFSTPLVVFLTGQFSAGVLPDSVTGSPPALRQDAIVRLDVGDSRGQTTTSAPGGSPCPPCQFAWPPPHVSAVGRFALQLLHDNKVDFDRLVIVWLVLCGAGAGLVGWAVGSIFRSRGASESRRAERAGSLAAQRDRPRGAGYRAGLAAPSGL